MSAATLPLPTAVGPASTVSRLRRSVTRSELFFECRDLLGAEAAHPAALGDAQALHDLAGPDLAEARHRLQQVDDPHLADDLVGVALSKHVADRGAVVLEP